MFIIVIRQFKQYSVWCPQKSTFFYHAWIFKSIFGIDLFIHMKAILVWLKMGSDSKVHVANMGPTCVLSVPDGLYVGPMNIASRQAKKHTLGRGPIESLGPIRHPNMTALFQMRCLTGYTYKCQNNTFSEHHWSPHITQIPNTSNLHWDWYLKMFLHISKNRPCTKRTCDLVIEDK